MNYNQVIDFLRENCMYYADLDYIEMTEKMIQEMSKGLQHNRMGSSLGMLPTYIDVSLHNQNSRKVLVIDAGGTNFRNALMQFNHDGISMDHFDKVPMPGSLEPINVKQFFKTIVDRIEPLVETADALSFCFSYPAVIGADRDGQVIHLTKEVSVVGIEGAFIGKSINAELTLRGKKTLPVTILNDTVAVLLAGAAEHEGYGGYIGFILGTGVNIAYIEAINEIHSIETRGGKSMIINVESGGYNQFPKGKFDTDFIAMTQNADAYQAEKVMSGAYLGGLTSMAIKGAAERGLLSNGSCQRLERIEQIRTKDIGEFIQEGLGALRTVAVTESDAHVIRIIIDALIERSAMFSSIMLYAGAVKSTRFSDNPICITVEGTTWNKLSNYSQRVDVYLNQYLRNVRGIDYKLVSIDDATFKGSAFASLCDE